MPLGAFPTFLAFLTRKLRWSLANQKTLPEIRREALGRRLAAEQTRSLLDGLVRAVWLWLVTTKTGSRAIPSVAGQLAALFWGTSARKVRKARNGVRVMTRSTFLAFLTFLTQALRLPVPANNPWHGLDIPPYLRRERLGPPTVEPEAKDFTGRLHPASTTSTLRRALPRHSDRSASESLAGTLVWLAERI